MGFSDAYNYLLFDNPVSKGLIEATKNTFSPMINTKQVPTVTIIKEYLPLRQLSAEHGPFIKLAGIMGATAVSLGAYGAHRKYPKDRVDELKAVCQTANTYHFLHSLALFGVPFSRHPRITGSLFITGTLFFSGACYYKAFTGKDTFGKVAPVGGIILILAWISMVI